MSTRETRQQVALALGAAQDRKAEDITLLELPKESSAFTDFFLICSGNNPRQVQAIADAVDEALSKKAGVEPNNREGYDTAEWILLDYVDFVVHIFSTSRRGYYDLERLWKSAKHVSPDELLKPATAKKTVAAGKKTAAPVKKAAAKRPAAKKAVAKKAAKKPARRR